jgi:hypothetical protein
MSKRTLIMSSMLCVGIGLAACSGGGGAVYGGSVSAGVSYGVEPPLVEVEPDVWVVENYDEPVFYVDNSYWMWRGGHWYRSSYYDRGWVVVYEVPYRVRSIDRPHAYVRYHARDGARWRQGPRGRVIVRDHRDRSTYSTPRERYDRRAPSQRYLEQQRIEQRRAQENLREERRNQAEMERRLRASREQEQQRQQAARQAERERMQAERRQELEQQRQLQAERQREQLARQQERQERQKQLQNQREQRQEQRQEQREQREQRQEQRKQQQKKQKKQPPKDRGD